MAGHETTVNLIGKKIQTSIFYSRPAPQGEDNHMIALKKEYEATGGKFIEHDDAAEIFPGAWLTGDAAASQMRFWDG